MSNINLQHSKSHIPHLQSLLNCNWSNKSIQYLGIQLTNNPNSLYKANYTKLLTSIKQDLISVSKPELSWLGRIAALKMSILPKILYIFRTVPIPVQVSFFTKINSLLRSYIWGTKKARIAFSTLTRHKSMGGMGVPHLRNYYRASILVQLKDWCAPQPQKQWSILETGFQHNIPLKNLLIAAATKQPLHYKHSGTIDASLNTWIFFLENSQGDKININVHNISLRSLEFLTPNLSMSKWSQEGHTTWGEVSDNLKKSDAFTTQRVNHIISSLNPIGILLDKEAWEWLNDRSDSTKGINFFYSKLQDTSRSPKLPTIIKWETDLGKTFTVQQWSRALNITLKATHCTAHWENTYKILHRWYMTPVRLKQIYTTADNQCWRNCGEPGNLLHILWKCKSVLSFWKSIFSLISRITGTITPASPELALLGLTLDKYPNDQRCIMTHILIAARLTVLSKWKKDLTPTLEEVISRVTIQYSYEKAFAIATAKILSFDRLWNLWTRYTHN